MSKKDKVGSKPAAKDAPTDAETATAVEERPVGKAEAEAAAVELPLVESRLDAKFFEGAAAALVPMQHLPKPVLLKEVRSRIVQLAEAGGKLEILAGELLYQVRENEFWKDYQMTDATTKKDRAYESFDEYVEKEVPFGRRKAFYLIAIYEKFVVELAIPVDVLREVEWSKAKEVVSIINEKNWKDLLAILPKMTVKDVIEMVQEVKGESAKTTATTAAKPAKGETVETTTVAGEEGEEEMVEMTFKLFKAQAENIETALKVAAFETGSDKAGHHLDMICTDFIAGRASPESGDRVDAICGRLDVIIQRLERTFGVKLEVSGATTMPEGGVDADAKA